MRSKGGRVGLVMLAALMALAGAATASASTATLRGGETVVYQGDPGADAVTLWRYVDTRGNNKPNDDVPYYMVTDDGGITSGSGCVRANSTTSACRVTASLKRYDVSTGGGDDKVDVTGPTLGGTADLGAGADRFTGLATGAAADTVNGGDGDDTIAGGDGADALTGEAGDDQVAGQAGNDAVDGGAGNDSLEFGAADVAAGAGAGADDLRGGDGVDRLSYLDHAAAVTVTLDEQPGDGSAGEGDDVHDDIETVIATTHDDVLTGDGASQDLYGNAGNDTIDGGAGGDLVNGGSGDDTVRGGAGDDTVQGSAGGDLLDGGPGQDLFEGDNDCVAEPCTGGSDEIQARDGEEDEINCGVGADTATVDAIDIVAVDSQHGCESIDRAAAPAAPPAAQSAPALAAAPGTTAAAAETPPRTATMRVLGALKLRSLLKKGLAIEVTCPGACRIRARLILGRKVVASARRARLRGGDYKLTLKAIRGRKRPLRRHRKLNMTLVVDVVGAAEKTTLDRPLRFTR